MTRKFVEDTPRTGRTAWEKKAQNDEVFDLLERVRTALRKEQIEVKLLTRGPTGPGDPTGIRTRDFKEVLQKRLNSIRSLQDCISVLNNLRRVELSFDTPVESFACGSQDAQGAFWCRDLACKL